MFTEMAEIQKATAADFEVTANYYEIYHERIYDLLSEVSWEEQKDGCGPKLFSTVK